MIIYNRAIHVTLTSERRIKRVILKPGLGYWQTMLTLITCHKTGLLKSQVVTGERNISCKYILE